MERALASDALAVLRRVVIVTGPSLSRNPRVIKEAMTLARAGYQVTVASASTDATLLNEDRALAASYGFAYKRARGRGPETFLSSLSRRVRTRIAVEFCRRFGIESRWQLGVSLSALLTTALEERADFYIVHCEQGAWVGCQLMDAGCRVGADFEDWYSEDLFPETRRFRPLRLLRKLEQKLLREGAHVTCPSKVMSRALAAEYGRTATVLYNAFPWSDRASIDGLRKDRVNADVPSIHWFSQTLGPGRGLQELFAALAHLNHPAEVHLRGEPVAGFSTWAAGVIPSGWAERVFIHGLISNQDLLSRIAEHDIGFAGEMKFSRSRELTVTNKILYYLLAGLAVVASDTAGQQEIADEAAGAVFVYRSGDPAHLARQLNALLESPVALDRAKQAALHAAREKFCWEKQEPVLLDTVAGRLTA